MMKTLQRLGKSLMLPVACLPAAGILMGIGYWIDQNVMSGLGDPNVVAFFLVKAGGAIIDNMAILFAIGVAVGMSKDQDGTSALAGLVSWLMTQQILSPAVVGVLTGAEANAAFGKINNQFIGIVSGLIGAFCYNKFKDTKLPDALAFFSGKRCVAIMAALMTLIVDLILFFVWPFIYGALISLGEAIMSLGAVGVGIYTFLNRLLIPVGLHHALNSVFWFDVAGINDIARFWGTASVEGLQPGEAGMYMSGFFPVMMFGLPAAALAMYHTAKSNKKKVAAGLLFSGALCAFFTGVTEPLEFSFMFLAPVLYVIYALMCGIVAGITVLFPFRAGFWFSAGFVDWFFSFKAPNAEGGLLLIFHGAADMDVLPAVAPVKGQTVPKPCNALGDEEKTQILPGPDHVPGPRPPAVGIFQQKIRSKAGIHRFTGRDFIVSLPVFLYGQGKFPGLIHPAAVPAVLCVHAVHIAVTAAFADFMAAVPRVPSGHGSSSFWVSIINQTQSAQLFQPGKVRHQLFGSHFFKGDFQQAVVAHGRYRQNHAGTEGLMSHGIPRLPDGAAGFSPIDRAKAAGNRRSSGQPASAACL